jgi:hypothetical protein
LFKRAAVHVVPVADRFMLGGDIPDSKAEDLAIVPQPDTSTSAALAARDDIVFVDGASTSADVVADLSTELSQPS